MPGDIHPHPCPDCNGTRNCMVLFSHTNPNNKGLMFGSIYHQLLQCMGCNAIFYHINRTTHSKIFAGLSQEYYPATKAVQYYMPLHLHLKHDDTGIFSLYAEVTSAINAGLPQLAAAGARTVIDRICLDLTKSNMGFTANIQKLYELKHISKPQYEHLSIIIDVGNGVVHRRHSPDIKDVILSHEIITMLINTLYLHAGPLQDVKSRTPERKKN